MAQRRMFSKTILDSDKFMDMQAQSQALYLHLNLKADDEGFVGSMYKITKMLGLEQGHIDELTNNEFIIIFKSGICLIRHWHIHNYIRRDRLVETIYQQEKSKVHMDEQKMYVLGKCDTKKFDRQMTAQDREDEVRSGKVSAGKERAGDISPKTQMQKLLDNPKYKFPYKLTPKSLSEYSSQMHFSCIRFALDEAAVSEKHSLGYVRAILDRLLREGITTKERLENHIKNRHGPKKTDVNKGVLSHEKKDSEHEKLAERFEEI